MLAFYLQFMPNVYEAAKIAMDSQQVTITSFQDDPLTEMFNTF